jgi:hypothetical protein
VPCELGDANGILAIRPNAIHRAVTNKIETTTLADLASLDSGPGADCYSVID